MSLVNLGLFCLFFAILWCFCFDVTALSVWGVTRTHLEMALLQTVSLLMVICAWQMPTKAAPGWRPLLLTMSFVALSESTLVAILTPLSGS